MTTRNQDTGPARGMEGSVRKAYGSVCESAAKVPERRKTQRTQSAGRPITCVHKHEKESRRRKSKLECTWKRKIEEKERDRKK